MDSLIRLLFLSFFLLTSSFAATSEKLITIYGLEKGKQIKTGRSGNFRYQLQIGAFKDRQNAIKYKDQLSKKTSAPIAVVSADASSGLYFVVAGPLPDAMAVKTVCDDLLVGKRVGAPAVAFKNNGKANKHKAPAPVVADNQAVKNNMSIQKAILAAQIAQVNISPGQPVDLQNESDVQTQQIVQGMDKATTFNSDREWHNIEILNRESVANELKLKVSTSPEEIMALQKRQLEINNELQKKVSVTIERIRQASR